MLYIEDNATRRFGRFVHGVGALLTLGSAVAAYLLFYAPTMKATEQAHRKIAELEQALHQAPAIQRQHAQLSERLREMEDRVKAIHQRVPREAKDSEFLSALTRLADEVGIVITELTPGPPQKKSGYSQMDISITGRASYEGLCRFLHGISRFRRLVKVVGLSVRQDANREGAYPVTVTVAIFFNVHGPRSEESVP